MNPANEQTDKILQHNQQQLSALMDGALSPDEARFLLRRLQHDEALAQCWSRWQLSGDILRGQAYAPAPSGFAQRVAAAIAAHDPQTTTAPHAGARRNRAWWGSGMALAASVAVLALFATRQSPDVGQPAESQPAQVAASQTPVSSTHAGERDVATPSRSTPGLPDAATGLAAVAAVAELPRRASARRSRGQSQRAALRTTRGNTEPQTVLAVASPSTENAVRAFATNTTVDPFRRPQTAVIPTRPWPRALLPQSASSGAFTVDYGSQDGTTSARFYPFRPQVQQDASVENNQVQEIPSPAAPASDDANRP